MDGLSGGERERKAEGPVESPRSRRDGDAKKAFEKI